MEKIIEFLNKLEEENIYYSLNKINDYSVMVEIAVPGERWEVEFMLSEHKNCVTNDDVRVEIFRSNGEIFDSKKLKELYFS